MFKSCSGCSKQHSLSIGNANLASLPRLPSSGSSLLFVVFVLPSALYRPHCSVFLVSPRHHLRASFALTSSHFAAGQDLRSASGSPLLSAMRMRTFRVMISQKNRRPKYRQIMRGLLIEFASSPVGCSLIFSDLGVLKPVSYTPRC